MNDYIKNFFFAPYAVSRSQHRGLKLDTIDLILKFGKVKHTRIANFYFVSKIQIKSLLDKKLITHQQAEAIENIVLFLNRRFPHKSYD